MHFFGHDIQFEHPGWISWGWLTLVFVLAVCVFGFLNMLALRSAYSHEDNLKRTTRALTWTGAVLKTALYGLMAVLLAVALSEPFEENQPTVIPAGSVHIATAFDVSPSMAAEDYRDKMPVPAGPDGIKQVPLGPWGSRLQMAKWLAVEDMMRAMPGNKIAIGVYTAEPWPQAPLSEDYSTLRFMMTDTGWIGIGAAPGGGSDYVQGLKLAIQALREDYDPNKRQVIVIFSDGGVSFDSEEEKAQWQKDYAAVVQEVQALKAEVIVIGLGSTAPQLVPVYHPVTLQRVDWFPVGEEKKEKTALDEAALQQFAQACGGKYVHVSTDDNTPPGIDWINTIGGTKVSMGKKLWTSVPLGAAMLVFVALMLRGLWRRGDIVPPSGW